jgi:predicted RNA-binding Zn ribbon-like protein
MFLVKCGLMETRTVRELPVVGGHLALDFANTVDDPEGANRHDHIATYPDLLAWSVRLGALSPAGAKRLRAATPRAAAAAVRRGHALRATVIETFTGVATGAGAVPWADLRQFVADAVTHADLSPAGRGYELTWAAGNPRAMLWPVAQAAAELLTGPDLGRVKRCAGCPWLFLDRSKNSSRRWCDMNDCGTNAKIQRYVARRRDRRTSTP